MKIVLVNKGRIDIEYKGRMVVCGGDLLQFGFGVPIKEIEWMNPENPKEFLPMSEAEKQEFMREVILFARSLPNKDEVITFYDETDNRIVFPQQPGSLLSGLFCHIILDNPIKPLDAQKLVIEHISGVLLMSKDKYQSVFDAY